MRRLKLGIAGSLLLACLLADGPAKAQLVLPGAMPPSAAPVVGPPAGGAAGAKPNGPPSGGPPVARALPVRAPGEEAVAGLQLQRNGSAGIMAIDRVGGGGLEIGRLALLGFQISRPTEVCRVEVSGGKISLRPAERREGLLSYEAQLETCPFSLDVLEGAARVRGRTCDFVAADCRVDPTGVWGPPGASIGPAEAKNIESARGKAESEARGSFRELLAAAKGNKATIKELARNQASFSSIREEICRDYALEDKHGFCASRITMAHAVALSAQLHGPKSVDSTTPPKKKPKPKPKPAAPIAPPPVQ